VAQYDGAATGETGRPVFVDDAGRRARIVRPVAVAAGALVVAFMIMVGSSLFGAPWVPKLSLRVPDQGGTRVAARPFRAGPAAPAAPLLSAAPSRAGVGGAGATALSSRSAPAGAPATSFVPAPGTTVFMPLTATTAAPRSSTTPAATRGQTHKKASTATTTTTTVAALR